MANICSSTPIRDTSIKGLTAELNFIRSTICTLQSQVINGGGGGGPTIYTGDGSLATDRVIDLNGKRLSFNQNSHNLLDIDPINFIAFLTAYDGTSSSGLDLNAKSGQVVSFDLDVTNGVNEIEIVGNAISNTLQITAGSGAISYNGATHNFTGAIQTGGTPGVSQGPFTTITSITVVNGLVTDLQGS